MMKILQVYIYSDGSGIYIQVKKKIEKYIYIENRKIRHIQ